MYRDINHSNIKHRTVKIIILKLSEFDRKTPSRSEDINNMLSEFPQRENFPRSRMHCPLRNTGVLERVITIIEGNTSASTFDEWLHCQKSHWHINILCFHSRCFHLHYFRFHLHYICIIFICIIFFIGLSSILFFLISSFLFSCCCCL